MSYKTIYRATLDICVFGVFVTNCLEPFWNFVIRPKNTFFLPASRGRKKRPPIRVFFWLVGLCFLFFVFRFSPSFDLFCCPSMGQNKTKKIGCDHDGFWSCSVFLRMGHKNRVTAVSLDNRKHYQLPRTKRSDRSWSWPFETEDLFLLAGEQRNTRKKPCEVDEQNVVLLVLQKY